MKKADSCPDDLRAKLLLASAVKIFQHSDSRHDLPTVVLEWMPHLWTLPLAVAEPLLWCLPHCLTLSLAQIEGTCRWGLPIVCIGQCSDVDRVLVLLRKELLSPDLNRRSLALTGLSRYLVILSLDISCSFSPVVTKISFRQDCPFGGDGGGSAERVRGDDVGGFEVAAVRSSVQVSLSFGKFLVLFRGTFLNLHFIPLLRSIAFLVRNQKLSRTSCENLCSLILARFSRSFGCRGCSFLSSFLPQARNFPSA